jgi:hypothetical protein
MVSHHGCIRVIKQSLALLSNGHQVEIAAQQAPFGYNRLDALLIWNDGEQLQRVVRSSCADVFHVHNEPDWMVAAVKDAAEGRPVVYDIHDLESMRWQREPDEDELEAFDAADGIVHVSEPCRLAAERWHGNGKPAIVLPPYVNEEFVKTVPESVSWSALAYEGGLSSDAPVTYGENGQPNVNMRSYLSVVEAFIGQGYSVYLFAPDGQLSYADLTYENLGAFVARGSVYPVMLAGLRASGFGLVGSVVSAPLMEAAMPNKLFEYVSQGVVPVCLNAGTAADYVESLGVGIRLNGLDNLREQLAQGPELRKNLLAVRAGLTMEEHIGALINLYREVCK